MQAECYEFFKENNTEILVCSDDNEAFYIDQALQFLGKKTFVLPDFRAVFGEDLRAYNQELTEIFMVLSSYYNENAKKILISPIRTILNPLPKAKHFDSIKLSFADEVDLNLLKETLKNWGYSFVDVVETHAEVSFRGDVFDIFAPNFKKPIRVSLFDTEIESIREFDCQSQRSEKEELESFSINPVFFALNKTQALEIEQKIQNISSDAFVKDIESLGFWAMSEEMENLLLRSDFRCTSLVENELKILQEERDINIKFKFLPLATKYKDLQTSGDINTIAQLNKNKQITIIARNETLLKQANLEIPNLHIKESPLIVNLISNDKIIISLNKKQTKRKKARASILLDELKIGDYVVHEEYGIGIFKGLEKTKILGSVRDFVSIFYQNEDKLLLPVENLSIIDRFIADSGSIAVLDKLGKGSFVKLKEKVKMKLFEIANAIIEMAAIRELSNAIVIKSDFKEIAEFVQNAGFIYTKDQEKAISEIFDELNSGKIMDRLLSGDVGFGKTEVAMNAILATIKSGFQALFIAPTTLLSAQHFKTLNERLSKFDIKVARLDRFCDTKTKSRVLKELNDGKIDICVGTHALLGVKCKKLALLIIDEEHKFGVKQKEKLKELSQDIHLLSMSATPIPRSLNMALSKVKTYSSLLTPPLDREDVRTFVKQYDEKLVKEVISREIRRNGQIFYVYNKIATIEQKAKEIKKILPSLRVLILHSKVAQSVSEKEMMKFEAKEYDLLLCTSIIESGIHLPNVNTIIIEEANNFGMADLHQLRGRVGRAKRQGYCYFLVKDDENLSEQAKKRLIALESNSFLGSGSVLAYHDLEIRGGGNLIGAEQSGHIKQIGYSLYIKMLEDAINELAGTKTNLTNLEKNVDIKLSINAYLSSEYVGEDRVRLELYRRLSKCKNTHEILEIELEMNDRFGKLDTPTKQFLELITIKVLSMEQNIKLVSNYAQNITIIKQNNEKISLKSRSKDDDDIIDEVLRFLRKK